MRTITIAAFLVAFVVSLGVAAPAPVRADDSAALNQLLQNVQYWEARGRPDKAAQIWQKILRSDPKHAGALAALCLYNARLGRNDQAKVYLERLQRDHPGHAKISSLRTAVGLGRRYDDILADARAAVRSGKVHEGIELYRKLFGDQQPTGSVGLEFYQTLGGTLNGWEEARSGLTRLHAANQGAARYELALAQHLTYKERTRREGVRRLSALAGDARVAKQVRPAWKKGLLWLNATTADLKLYAAYLERYPDDAEIKKDHDAIQVGQKARAAVNARSGRLKAAYNALEGEDVDKAEVIFKKAVKARGNDVNAMFGLAMVAMQKERFQEARAMLEQVKKVAPARKDLWEGALQSAEFWDLVQRAKVVKADKDLKKAKALLEEAIERSPREAHHAELVLGNVQLELKEYTDAELTFENLIKREKSQADALKALVELYLRRDKGGRALAANAQLKALAPDDAYREDWIRAETLRRKAIVARGQGDPVTAMSLLRIAEETDPGSKDVMLELAYVALELDEVTEARETIDRLRAKIPDDTSAKIADAWIYAAEARHQKGYELLERMGDDELDDSTRLLKRRLRVEHVTAQAVKQGLRGKPLAAAHRLMDLQRQNQDAPPLLGLIANAWADMDRFDRALSLMYDALNKQSVESPTLKLQLAAILHKAGREAELLAVLRELDTDPNLSRGERRGLNDLQIAYAIRRADIAREAGHQKRAFKILSQPLREFPDDLRLMNGLGRLFVSAGEHDEANSLFSRVLERAPGDLEARAGAIQSAVEVGDDKKARTMTREGIARMPEEPRMHLIAGRMHVMLGEDGDAIEALELALALEEGRATTGALEAAASEDSYNKLLDGAASAFGASSKREAGGADLTLRREIELEIQRLHSRHAVKIGTSAHYRTRPGRAGLENLNEFSFPTYIDLPIGYKVRLRLMAEPVIIDTGSLDLGDPKVKPLFGSSAVDTTTNAGNAALDHSGAGAALTLGLKIGGLELQAGSTPLGLLRQTVVGEASWGGALDGFGFRIEGYRRAVRDSLLSYGGLSNIAPDLVWGGVLRHGGRIDMSLSSDEVVGYVFGAGGVLLGEHVQTNWHVDAGAGLLWTIYDWDDASFVMGLSGLFMMYNHNLRHYTLGHGGYFSPQQFVNGGIPLEYRDQFGDVSLKISANLGLNWFIEDPTPYYPLDPNRMDELAQRADLDGNPLPTHHVGQEAFSFALTAAVDLRYRVSQDFELGLRGSAYNGHDYEEYKAMFFAGYTFSKKVQVRSSMPEFGGLLDE